MPYKPTGRPRGRPRRDGTPAGSPRVKAAREAEKMPQTAIPSEMVGNTDGTGNNLRGPWQKGESGNPAGMPKGYVSFGNAYRLVSTLPDDVTDAILDGKFPEDWTRPRSVMFQVAARAFRKMRDEAPPALLSEVADRSDGKVTQPIAQSIDVKGIIALPAPPPGVAWLDVIETHLAGTLPPAPDTDD